MRQPTADTQSQISLRPEEQEWLRKKWSKIRSSQQKADAASNEWNAINDAVKRKFAAEDRRREERGEFPLTDLMKAQAKSASLPLKDALATHKWHAEESQRHIDDVNLFLRMKELGVL